MNLANHKLFANILLPDYLFTIKCIYTFSSLPTFYHPIASDDPIRQYFIPPKFSDVQYYTLVQMYFYCLNILRLRDTH